MRILVDEDRCAGHGRCYTLVPALFESDEQGHSVVLVDGPLNDEQVADAETAIQNCPEQAITFVAD